MRKMDAPTLGISAVGNAHPNRAVLGGLQVEILMIFGQNQSKTTKFDPPRELLKASALSNSLSLQSHVLESRVHCRSWLWRSVFLSEGDVRDF